jgi:hypothetical protein
MLSFLVSRAHFWLPGSLGGSHSDSSAKSFVLR